MNRPVVRPARVTDLDEVTAIYNEYVAGSHVTFDVDPVADGRSWYSQFGEDGPHRLFVADQDGSIAGWASSTPVRPRAAYRRSVETTAYITPAAGGRGIGTALYEALLDALGPAGVHRCYAAIALPNPASVALHERFGFSEVGRFSEVGFKLGRYWDVAWFERRM
jgi:phosphinothricin acetyltransferase